MSPLDLLAIQVETLFVCDPSGRLLHARDPWGTMPAPHFFLARTPAGNLWRARHDLPSDLVAELDAIARHEPVVDDLTRPLVALEAILDLLSPATSPVAGSPTCEAVRGPVWLVPEDVQAPPLTSGQLVEITPANADLVADGAADPRPDLAHLLPCAAVIEDGRAVTRCYCSRLTDRAAEAGLGTVAAYRGRGHGPVATAAWARLVRATGRLPFYSTSWENAASHRVAVKLGLQLVGEDISFK